MILLLLIITIIIIMTSNNTNNYVGNEYPTNTQCKLAPLGRPDIIQHNGTNDDSTYIYIYIYIYIHTHMYVSLSLYIYIERERYRCRINKHSSRCRLCFQSSDPAPRISKLTQRYPAAAHKNECVCVCLSDTGMIYM